MTEQPLRGGDVPPGDPAGGSPGGRWQDLASVPTLPRLAHPDAALGRRRRLAGWALAVALPPLLAVALRSLATEQLPLAVLLFLAAAVLTAIVGGMLPALLGAVVGFGLLNWFFTPPVGRWSIAEPTDLVALLVYVAVASGVAAVVHRASRRAAEAERARAEAATLASLSHSVLTGQDTAEVIVARLREAFDQDAVTLVRRVGTEELAVASSGDHVDDPGTAETRVPVDAEHVLVLHGRPLLAGDHRVLEAFAVQAGLVLEYRRLRERESRAAALERAEATSTALLRGVSHDLRTPLATLRAALDGLAAPGVTSADRRVLLDTLGAAVERLQSLIDDLLDLSRLRSGLLHPVLRPVSLEEVLPPVVAEHPPGCVVLALDESTPLVETDPGLLARVVANLVANAVRVSDGTPVGVVVHSEPSEVAVRVVDHGPGVPVQERERMFEPFQRLGDGAPGGLGLGLAVARGLAEVMGASLRVSDTPEGGLTMTVAVPRPVGVRRPETPEADR